MAGSSEGGTVNLLVRCRGLVVALLALSVVLPPRGAMAQGGITATLFSPGGTGPFQQTDPIPMTLQLSGGSSITFKGFSGQDLLGSLLNFSGPGGVINSSVTALKIQPIQCFSRSGVLLSTAIPVVRIEGPPVFPLFQSAPDIRKVYGITVPGSYTVNAQIPFVNVDPSVIINDCDQVSPPGSVVNVGSGATGLQGTTIVSNFVAFTLCCFTFTGFFSPVGPACPTSGCVTTNLLTNRGNTVPFKFQVSDSKGNVVKSAVATISAQVPGPYNPQAQLPIDLDPGTTPVNQFRLSTDQYIFNVASGQLPSTGIWQFNVKIDDGSIHSAWVELR